MVLYALQLLPSIIWVRFPPVNDVLADQRVSRPLLEALEWTGGVTLVVALILLVRGDGLRGKPTLLKWAGLFLFAYYLSWVVYYAGVVEPWLLIVFMAGMPVLYFLFVARWLRNHLALIPLALFGLMHPTISVLNYL